MTSLLLSATFSILTGVNPPVAAHGAVIEVHFRHPHLDLAAQAAFEQGRRRGSRDGARAGRSDARRHRGFDPDRHTSYRIGDRGYKHRFGPRRPYVDGYRQGFKRAYRAELARHACRRCTRSHRHHW